MDKILITVDPFQTTPGQGGQQIDPVLTAERYADLLQSQAQERWPQVQCEVQVNKQARRGQQQQAQGSQQTSEWTQPPTVITALFSGQGKEGDLATLNGMLHQQLQQGGFYVNQQHQIVG